MYCDLYNYLLNPMNRIVTSNTFKPGHNDRDVTDDIVKCIFVNENCCILDKISLRYVPKGIIDKIAALVQIMAWHRNGCQSQSAIYNWLATGCL